MPPSDPLSDLTALHVEIDREAAGLARRHAERLHCARGCASCCVDGLTVFAIEAERIRRAHAVLLREAAAHPEGACALLDGGGACRVYGARPYVCRTQGLPLRWIGEEPDGGLVERRDICPLNAEGAPIESIPEDACWTIGPYEGRLAELQRRFGEGRMDRVALRSLFERI